MKFKVEVTTDGTEWANNDLRFETPEAAEQYAIGLSARWRPLKAWRVVSAFKPRQIALATLPVRLG